MHYLPATKQNHLRTDLRICSWCPYRRATIFLYIYAALIYIMAPMFFWST